MTVIMPAHFTTTTATLTTTTTTITIITITTTTPKTLGRRKTTATSRL